MAKNNSQSMTNAAVEAFVRCGMSKRDAKIAVQEIKGSLRTVLNACAEAFSVEAGQQNTRAHAPVYAQQRRYTQ